MPKTRYYYSHFVIGSASKSELVQLTDCICPRYNVTYECTVCGEGATLWTGSLFGCDAHQIALRHSRFVNDSVSGECNNINGAVIARSIRVSVINTSQCYSSQLIVFASDEIIGKNKTVTCLHFNGTNENVIDTLLMGNTGTIGKILYNNIYRQMLQCCYMSQ